MSVVRKPGCKVRQPCSQALRVRQSKMAATFYFSKTPLHLSPGARSATNNLQLFEAPEVRSRYKLHPVHMTTWNVWWLVREKKV